MVTVQPAERCPVCASAVRPGAQWCTLCFADLRPVDRTPATPPQSPSLAASAPASGSEGSADTVAGGSFGSTFDPLTAPLALLERVDFEREQQRRASELDGAQATDTDAGPDTDTGTGTGTDTESTSSVQAALAGWPCMTCGNVVSIELSACNECGAGFMAAGPGHRAAGGGFLSDATDKKAQLKIMIGGAGLLCVGILILLFVIGLLF